MEQFHAELINLVMIIVTACVGLVTKQVMTYLNKKGLLHQLENNKAIVGVVVKAVEQMYEQLHGNEKLNVAKIELIKLMKDKGIKISEKELDLLIHSSVNEMNQTIKEETK